MWTRHGWLALASALSLAPLAPAPAAAQEARPAPAPHTRLLRRKDLAPQLYFLRLQGLIQDKLVDPKAWRYDKEALVRVVLDQAGAVVRHDFVQRAGLPIYDRAVEEVLHRFGPEGVERLPVAEDAALKTQASGAGVLVTLRFRGTAPSPAPAPGPTAPGPTAPGPTAPGATAPGPTAPASASPKPKKER